MAKKKNGSWIVTVKRTVLTDVCVENCTEEQARKDPWGADVIDETDLEMLDWEVGDVRENE